MTEQEAIEYMRESYNHYLEQLPQQFWTKEFALKLMSECNIYLLIDELGDLDLIDYDTALVWCIHNQVDNTHLVIHYFDSILSKDDLEKLKTTLNMLGLLNEKVKKELHS